MLLIFCVKCVSYHIPCNRTCLRRDTRTTEFLIQVLLEASSASGYSSTTTDSRADSFHFPSSSYFLTSASKRPSEAMELDLPPEQVPPLADLAAAIHRAAAAAVALSEPSPSSHAAAAVAALRDAHAAIGSFLSRLDSTAASSGDEQPMMEDGREEAEQMVEEVKEGLRECALQGSKRRKRPVPPSWPLGRRTSGSCEAAEAAAVPPLDVEGRRRAAMDLLLQFHA
jgi:hypothetical protein